MEEILHQLIGGFIPLFIGLQPSIFHPQYVHKLLLRLIDELSAWNPGNSWKTNS